MTLHVYRSECDWYVAESPQDAADARYEHEGNACVCLEPGSLDRCGCIDTEAPFELSPDDSQLCVKFDAIEDVNPEFAHLIPDDSDREEAIDLYATCEEWARIAGRGILCSTEY